MDIFGGRNSFLAKVKDFIARAKGFIELRKDKIKIVAIPVLVIAAVLFFGWGLAMRRLGSMALEAIPR